MTVEFEIKIDEKTDLSAVVSRIEWLAGAGAALAVDECPGPLQGLFEQIVDLANPLYHQMIERERREGTA